MALISCYECNDKISHLAESCPSCGAPSETDSKKLESLIKISDFESEIELLQKRKHKFDKFVVYVSLWFVISLYMWIFESNEVLSRMGEDMAKIGVIVLLVLAQFSYSSYEKKQKIIKKRIQFEENWTKNNN